MQFDLGSVQDIKRLALEIDSAHGDPEIFEYPIIVRFKGRLASFSRPEFKTEKLTYPVPTFSALRNMLQAIYWHPGFNYIPVACGIVNPIEYQSIATNGVKEIKKALAGGHIILRSPSDVLQRTQTYIVNPDYVVVAFLASRPAEMKEGDSFKKFEGIINNRLKKGSCAYQPVLGMRECSANFYPVKWKELDGDPFINKNEDLGLMVFDFDYSYPDAVKIPLFQKEKIENGVVYYTGEVIR